MWSAEEVVVDFLFVIWEGEGVATSEERRQEAMNLMGAYVFDLLGKGKIKGGAPLYPASAVGFAIPDRESWGRRLPAVLAVVYLIFNEGYGAAQGRELTRPLLCAEARRLASLLAELLPDEPEVHGLAALVALHGARMATRVDDYGDVVLLEDQDRSRWEARLLEEGRGAIERALAAGSPGPVTLQAMVAACHSDAGSWEDTDWDAIVVLYDRLLELSPSPVVELNRAVAVSMASSPGQALALVDGLGAAGLGQYHLLWATRADFLRRLGRPGEAEAAYRRAASLTGNEAEWRFLAGRAERCAVPRHEDVS
jgi:RNA polymerase sigma-70 factor (ECF subfamily)